MESPSAQAAPPEPPEPSATETTAAAPATPANPPPATMRNGETPSTSVQNADASTLTTAPPQPPLPPSDPPFTLPEIVHGIDPQDDAAVDAAPALAHQPSMTEVLTSLTARVHRAVRFPALERLSAPASDTLPPPTRLSNPSVLLFGDSHTQLSTCVSEASAAPGWSALLRQAFEERVDFYVRGFSGYNSRWAVHILPQIVAALPVTPVTATILLGSNDATAPTVEQHVPIDEYGRNLAKLVLFLKHKAIVPVLISPPPLGSMNDVSAGRTQECMARYADACRTVARESGCAFVDFHRHLLEAGGRDGVDRFLKDGLHLSGEGSQALFDVLLKAFADVSKLLVPGGRPLAFPPWAEVDHRKPAHSLGSSELVDS